MKSVQETFYNCHVVAWFRKPNTRNGNAVYGFTIQPAYGGTINGQTKPNSMFVCGLPEAPKRFSSVTIRVTPGGRTYMVGAEV